MLKDDGFIWAFCVIICTVIVFSTAMTQIINPVEFAKFNGAGFIVIAAASFIGVVCGFVYIVKGN